LLITQESGLKEGNSVVYRKKKSLNVEAYIIKAYILHLALIIIIIIIIGHLLLSLYYNGKIGEL
jgi:cytochrome b subunit of formate dehydrogenase